MADLIADYVLDNGLNVLDTDADKIFLCSAEPTTYAEATATFAVGNKTFSAGGAWGTPTSASPNGQKVVSTVITDGVITADNTATKWATVDSVNSRLLARGSLNPTRTVKNGDTFALPAITIAMPST